MKDFRKSFAINATAEDIYACFTNRYTIELWSGSSAMMPSEPGGEFSWFDGDITGNVIKLIPGRIVEQEWFFGKKNAPSPVKITLREKGGATTVLIEQSGIPDDDYENITEGWEEHIIGGIATFLNPNF
ncbi:MAG: SRPBCC domain-containing protein [Bacteroidales bacterium]|nr:SRPBCC domain-containing protein [Bacteroidales bacterium]